MGGMGRMGSRGRRIEGRIEGAARLGSFLFFCLFLSPSSFFKKIDKTIYIK